MPGRPRVAVVGAGPVGLVAAHLRDGKEPPAAVPGGFSHGLRQGWVAALQNDPLFARWFAPYAGVDPD